MKCAVIGGGGFIGSALCRRLARSGYDVRLVGRTPTAPDEPRNRSDFVERRTADALDAQALRHAVAGVDMVVHLASTTDPASSNDHPVWDRESNLAMARNVLDAMLANDIARLVFLSSGGTVYGVADYLPIDERHTTEPIVAYGATKLAIEREILAHRERFGIHAVILRPANPYGVILDPDRHQGALSVFLRRALLGQPIRIRGDGSNIRDYLHVDDVADAIILGLNYAGRERVFNIGSGVGRSLNGVVTEIERLLGLTIAKQYGQAQDFDVPVNVLCSTLAQRELGWRPAISMEEGIVRVGTALRERLFTEVRI